MGNALSRTLRCVRDFGAGETLTRAARDLRLVEVAHSLSLYTEEVDRAWSSRPSDRPPLNRAVVRELSQEELAGLRQAEGLPPPEFYQKEFGRRARLLGLVRDKELLAVNWFNHRWGDLAYIKRPSVTFPEGTVYMHGARVALAHRGQGIGTFLKQQLFRVLKKEGYSLGVVAAYIANPKVHRWHQLNGFERWGNISYFRWAGRDFWWTRLTSSGRQRPGLLSFP